MATRFLRRGAGLVGGFKGVALRVLPFVDTLPRNVLKPVSDTGNNDPAVSATPVRTEHRQENNHGQHP